MVENIIICFLGIALFGLITLKEYSRDFRGPGVYLSPAYLGIAVLFLYFFVTGLVFLLIDPSLASDRSLEMNVSDKHLRDSLLAGLVGMLGLYFGARAGNAIRLPRVFRFVQGGLSRISSDIEQRPMRVYAIFLLFSLAGIAFEIYRQQAGFLHYGGSFSVSEKQFNPINSSLSLAIFLGNIGYCGLVYTVARVPLPRVFILLALGVVFALLVLIAAKGGALGPLNIFIPWLILYLYRPYFTSNTRKIPLYRSAAIASVCFVALATFKELVRHSSRDLGIGASVFGLMSLGPALFDDLNLQFVMDSVAIVLRTISGIDIISASKDYVEHEGYLYGSSYGLILIALIPSLLWKGKPEITMTTWFHDDVYRTPYEVQFLDTGLQGNNFLLVGEAYLNFGLIGIPFILFVYGVFLSLLARVLIRNSPGLLHFVLLSAIFYDIVHPATTVAALFAGLVKASLIVPLIIFAIWVGSRLTGGRRRKYIPQPPVQVVSERTGRYSQIADDSSPKSSQSINSPPRKASRNDKADSTLQG